MSKELASSVVKGRRQNWIMLSIWHNQETENQR